MHENTVSTIQSPRSNGQSLGKAGGEVAPGTDRPDQPIVEYLRRHGSARIGDLIRHTGVTATAVRQRLVRLMSQGLVTRTSSPAGRGRPSHRYVLTERGMRTAGTNYDVLAQALWDEIRGMPDPEIRQGLLKRVSDRIAATWREQVGDGTTSERMAALARLMGERNLPFVAEGEGQLPVLTALACPFPELAERDRSVCAMENMLLSAVVGEGLRLTSCRLDGSPCCTFEPRSNASGA